MVAKTGLAKMRVLAHAPDHGMLTGHRQDSPGSASRNRHDLQGFVAAAGLKSLAAAMVLRMVLALIGRRGRMMCAAAAGSVASEAVHRGRLTRPRWQKIDFNAPPGRPPPHPGIPPRRLIPTNTCATSKRTRRVAGYGGVGRGPAACQSRSDIAYGFAFPRTGKSCRQIGERRTVRPLRCPDTRPILCFLYATGTSASVRESVLGRTPEPPSVESSTHPGNLPCHAC